MTYHENPLVVPELRQKIVQPVDGRLGKKLCAFPDTVPRAKRLCNDGCSFFRSAKGARKYAGNFRENHRHPGCRPFHLLTAFIRQRPIVVGKPGCATGNRDAMTEEINFHALLHASHTDPK